MCDQGEEGERGTAEEGEEVSREGKKSSILGATFNFTNSIIGAGIIGKWTMCFSLTPSPSFSPFLSALACPFFLTTIPSLPLSLCRHSSCYSTGWIYSWCHFAGVGCHNNQLHCVTADQERNNIWEIVIPGLSCDLMWCLCEYHVIIMCLHYRRWSLKHLENQDSGYWLCYSSFSLS